MLSKRILCLALAALCILGLGGIATAVEVECDDIYCFSGEDFAQEEALTGVCITGLPDSSAGTVLLGSRVVRQGDILSFSQLEELTFMPLQTQVDRQATVEYLPIYENRVASAVTMTISILGKQDQAPVAQDSALETYKNLPNEGKLSVTDPEGKELTYTVIRGPKRGQVTVNADGSYTYTPKKNKVGTDSFTFTATDPAGNVSRVATVTIQILKPQDKTQYADTLGTDCRFTAEWMKNTGIFVGETISGKACFQPEKAVTRGEFLAMLVKTLDIKVDEDATTTGFTDDVPTWLKPYLAAALRTGLTENWPYGTTFGADTAITGAEAALLMQNALDLPTVNAKTGDDIPTWAAEAVIAMTEAGVQLDAGGALTRGAAANALYQISCLAPTAPGMLVFSQQ